MKQTLHDGIPFEDEYRLILESDLFNELEQFSNDFLSINESYLGSYRNQWVKDPLHQWSRQWEYPFVLSRVNELSQSRNHHRILDAGSGVTFFPFYLSSNISKARITCCDNNKLLGKIYKQLNGSTGHHVDFSAADLRNLPFANESIDMVYSISVIEHTKDYEKIVEELHRIIRPEGSLVLTFDISMDANRDIGVNEASRLLSVLKEKFKNNDRIATNLVSQLSKPGIFTTLTARKINPASLPWQLPSLLYRIQSFLTTGRFVPWPPTVTVFCLSLKKN